MLRTPAEQLYRPPQPAAVVAADANMAGASTAETDPLSASPGTDATQIASGSGQEAAGEEQKLLANVKLDFYQHVLRAILDLILAECSVQ